MILSFVSYCFRQWIESPFRKVRKKTESEEEISDIEGHAWRNPRGSQRIHGQEDTAFGLHPETLSGPPESTYGIMGIFTLF